MTQFRETKYDVEYDNPCETQNLAALTTTSVEDILTGKVKLRTTDSESDCTKPSRFKRWLNYAAAVIIGVTTAGYISNQLNAYRPIDEPIAVSSLKPEQKTLTIAGSVPPLKISYSDIYRTMKTDMVAIEADEHCVYLGKLPIEKQGILLSDFFDNMHSQQTLPPFKSVIFRSNNGNTGISDYVVTVPESEFDNAYLTFSKPDTLYGNISGLFVSEDDARLNIRGITLMELSPYSLPLSSNNSFRDSTYFHLFSKD